MSAFTSIRRMLHLSKAVASGIIARLMRKRPEPPINAIEFEEDDDAPREQQAPWFKPSSVEEAEQLKLLLPSTLTYRVQFRRLNKTAIGLVQQESWQMNGVGHEQVITKYSLVDGVGDIGSTKTISGFCAKHQNFFHKTFICHECGKRFCRECYNELETADGTLTLCEDCHRTEKRKRNNWQLWRKKHPKEIENE